MAAHPSSSGRRREAISKVHRATDRDAGASQAMVVCWQEGRCGAANQGEDRLAGCIGRTTTFYISLEKYFPTVDPSCPQILYNAWLSPSSLP